MTSISGGLRTSARSKAGTADQPLVTVITSVINGAHVLEGTIESVTHQTYPNIEYIVVDGNSSDDSVLLLQEHSGVIDYWVSELDSGIYDAWNKALRHARGDWIAFVGAGDQLLPDAIESLIKLAITSPTKLDLISAQVDLCRNGSLIRTVGKPWVWATYKKYMGIAHPGALHNAAYFRRYGVFNSSLKIAGDYELLLRAGPTLKTAFLNRTVVLMEVGGASTSAAVFEETAHIQLLYGLCTPLTGKMRTFWSRFKRALSRARYGY